MYRVPLGTLIDSNILIDVLADDPHAKAHFSELLSSIELGDEILITRHGRAIAKVSAPEQLKQAPALLKLAALRKSAPPWKADSAKQLRQLRDEE